MIVYLVKTSVHEKRKRSALRNIFTLLWRTHFAVLFWFSLTTYSTAEGFKRRTSLTNISLNILIKLEDNLSFLTNWKTCCVTKKKCFDTWQIETDVIETTLRGRSQTTFANWANFWPPTSVYIGWHLDYHLPTNIPVNVDMW